MDLQTLLQRLQSDEMAVRIETLQILAMVEEVDAIPAVADLFNHDSDPRVRKAAQWAGKQLWAAQQRGHTTQQAMQALYARQIAVDREALFLDSLTRDLPPATSEAQRRALIEQERLKHEMLNTFYDEKKPGDAGPSLADLAADLLGDGDELE